MISKIKLEKGNVTEDEQKHDEGQKNFLAHAFYGSGNTQKIGISKSKSSKYEMLGKRSDLVKDKVTGLGLCEGI